MQQIRAEWTKYDILSRYFGTAGLLVSPVLTCYNISPMSSVMNDTLARYLSIRGVSFKLNTASIVPGNERADEHARAAAGGGSPEDAVKDGYRRETSLSHMTRVATEARARPTAQWIAERTGDPRRGHRPPPGRGLGRKLLQRVPKCVAGRYYRLLHTLSTTTRIAWECQDSSVALIMGSLPRSLWPHDVVVCPLSPPWGVHDDARSPREIRRSQGK